MAAYQLLALGRHRWALLTCQSGLDDGVAQLSIGEKAKLTIPSGLAYAERGFPGLYVVVLLRWCCLISSGVADIESIMPCGECSAGSGSSRTKTLCSRLNCSISRRTCLKPATRHLRRTAARCAERRACSHSGRCVCDRWCPPRDFAAWARHVW